jgi:uncharacterized protein YjbI with pentapeptide repeats
MKFDIHNRWTGGVQFTAEIECADDAPISVKIGLAARWAIKTNAHLSGVDLSCANLSRVDLSCANLSHADLSGANLSHANLSHANISGVDLSCADLSRANIYGANLYCADLSGANISGANISGAKGGDLVLARTRILPDGDIIGWKKCADGVVVKLLIPSDAKRSHAFGRKCRAEFADVLEIIGADVARSRHDNKFFYRVGERVTPDYYDDDWRNECSGGIHFFITREEAEDW